MIPIKYILSVLLYILLLPISTPAGGGGDKGSSGKAGYAGYATNGGSGRSGRSGSKGGNGGRGIGIGSGASIFTNGNLLEWIGEQSIYGGIV